MAIWYWKLNDEKWMPVEEESSKRIEEEYQSHCKGKRTTCYQYQCFGDQKSALVNFDTMKTMCGCQVCIVPGSPKKCNIEFHLFRYLAPVLVPVSVPVSIRQKDPPVVIVQARRRRPIILRSLIRRTILS